MYNMRCSRCGYKWVYRGDHWRAQCPKCNLYNKTPRDPIKCKELEWMLLPDVIIQVAEKLKIDIPIDLLYILIGIGQDGLTAEIPHCRNSDENINHIFNLMSHNLDMLNKHPPKVKEELVKSLLKIYRKELNEFEWFHASP